MPNRLRPLVAAVAVVTLAVVVAACSAAAPPPSAAPSPAPSSASPALTPPVTVTPEAASAASLPPGATEVRPASAPRTVGASEIITVFTHCGFEGRLDWAGSFWREVRRVPAGAAIGDPEDTGRITLLSNTEAVFESSTGTRLVLERLPGAAVLFPCD